MSLKSYKFETETVELPNGVPIAVRGLDLVMVSKIIDEYEADLKRFFSESPAFDQVMLEAAGEDDNKYWSSTVIHALKVAPGLVAMIIALGADEPDAQAEAMTLPFSVQMDALTKIARLTFTQAGGPKKFLESVAALMRGVTETAVKLRLSKTGSNS